MVFGAIVWREYRMTRGKAHFQSQGTTALRGAVKGDWQAGEVLNNSGAKKIAF